jgi:hypothetical protein
MLDGIESDGIKKNECSEEAPMLYMPQPKRRFDVKSFLEAFLKLELEANNRKEKEDTPVGDLSNSSRSCAPSAGLSSREKPLNPDAPPFDPTSFEMAFPCPIVPLFLSSLDYSGSEAIGSKKNGSNLQVFQNLKKQL